ncbi:MAG TPA: GlsB/YeaQ/YmgE family stress response membrane protein [Blastocatellia bacterium]
MDVLAWIIFGLVVGVIAKAILPGKDPGGAIVTIIIGIVGSLIGGFIGRAVMGYGQINDSGDLSRPVFLTSLVLAVIGSIVLLAGYRLVKGRSLAARGS